MRDDGGAGDVRIRVHRAWLKSSVAMVMLIAVAAGWSAAEAQNAPRLRQLNPGTAGTAPLPESPQLRATLPTDPALRRADGGEETEPENAKPDDDGEPAEPQAPQDGLLEPAETPPPIDGVDPARDTRADEDVQAFRSPETAAGYDPSVFSIEPQPAEDRRPARFAKIEPYEPVGVRIGTFVLFPELELGATAFSNVLRSATVKSGDMAFDTRPSLRLVSNWAVHAVELQARGTASFHNEFPSEDDRDYALDARGRLDLSRRTNIEARLGREATQESRGTVNSRAGASGGTDITTDRAAVALNHRFNRLTVQLRGAVTETDYAPIRDETGATISNRDRDLRRQETAVRASWEFKPSLSVFGEAGTDHRDHFAANPADGIRRDSSGERYRAGVSFGTTSETLRGEVAIGTARQRFDDRRLRDVDGIVVDANLAWRVNGLTSVLLTAASDVGETTLAGSGGSLTRSAGVEVRHAFRRHLIGTAGARLSRSDYEGVELAEQEFQTNLGLEYFLNREVTVFGRYTHVDFSSSAPVSDYTADEVRVGVRVRR